jgi:hypothetical protein
VGINVLMHGNKIYSLIRRMNYLYCIYVYIFGNKVSTNVCPT